MRRIVSLSAVVIVVSGCSAAFWSGVANGYAATAPAGTGGLPASELLVFGGAGHKQFLGCLTCSTYDAGSIMNSYGDYGSKYSSTSILNPYSEYGSKYSDVSACSPYASDPPVIVDRQGNAYGRLTLNAYSGQVRNGNLIAWLRGVCG